MRKSPSPHAQFFTSLKHLEKRLKLENHPTGPSSSSLSQPRQRQETTKDTQQTQSLGTPIYLYDDEFPTTNTNTSNLQESEAPPEFLSRSPDFPPTPHEERIDQPERIDLDDDIELLMQLLKLTGSEQVEERIGFNDDGFLDKIVGAKGPKSVMEAERLDRWIKEFMKGEKKEAFRLAHLLLGKAAAFVHSDDGFGGLVFPSTIDDFLINDPPMD
ncbi:hypothetical protein ACS0TY_024563 [Phlomoides rotata]